MAFVDADIITHDTSLFTFDGSVAESDIEVEEDGFYKVTYSAVSLSTGGRNSFHGKIETNTGGGFTEIPYGGSAGYNRVNGGITQSAVSASTIVELSKDDLIRFTLDDEQGDTHTITDYHLDIEYLGTASSANVLRIHDSTGGVDLNSASDILIDWDSSDEEGDHFTFTGDTTPTDEITVNIDGIYHISYGIDSDNTATNTQRFGQIARLELDTGSGWNDARACFADGLRKKWWSRYCNSCNKLYVRTFCR